MAMVHVTLPDGTVNEYAAGITAGEAVSYTHLTLPTILLV